MINNALVEKTIYISLWAQFITTSLSLDGLNYELAIEDKYLKRYISLRSICTIY